MSENKSELLQKIREEFMYSEHERMSGKTALSIVEKAFEEYASQSPTLTPEEQQAMDVLKFPLAYNGSYSINSDNEERLFHVSSDRLSSKEAEQICNLVCRLLNAEQERRKK